MQLLAYNTHSGITQRFTGHDITTTSHSSIFQHISGTWALNQNPVLGTVNVATVITSEFCAKISSETFYMLLLSTTAKALQTATSAVMVDIDLINTTALSTKPAVQDMNEYVILPAVQAFHGTITSVYNLCADNVVPVVTPVAVAVNEIFSSVKEPVCSAVGYYDIFGVCEIAD